MELSGFNFEMERNEELLFRSASIVIALQKTWFMPKDAGTVGALGAAAPQL